VTGLLDRFIPNPDVRERHEIEVRAPAPLVLDTARSIDLESIPAVRAIIRMRERLLGAKTVGPGPRKGLVESTRELGWGTLSDEPGRWFVAGATCQPWLADVVFTPVPREQFADYAEPNRVKITWTLEVEPLASDRTRFASETRVIATDPAARRRFLGYWRWARVGILAIRWLLLPAVRRGAERRWRARTPASGM